MEELKEKPAELDEKCSIYVDWTREWLTGLFLNRTWWTVVKSLDWELHVERDVRIVE